MVFSLFKSHRLQPQKNLEIHWEQEDGRTTKLIQHSKVNHAFNVSKEKKIEKYVYLWQTKVCKDFIPVVQVGICPF